jgi:hypothetical protein
VPAGALKPSVSSWHCSCSTYRLGFGEKWAAFELKECLLVVARLVALTNYSNSDYNSVPNFSNLKSQLIIALFCLLNFEIRRQTANDIFNICGS